MSGVLRCQAPQQVIHLYASQVGPFIHVQPSQEVMQHNDIDLSA